MKRAFELAAGKIAFGPGNFGMTGLQAGQPQPDVHADGQIQIAVDAKAEITAGDDRGRRRLQTRHIGEQSRG